MSDNKALRRVQAARQALIKAQADYPQAIHDALGAGHGSDEVASAAGVSRQALYKTLRKTYGPRKDSGVTGKS